MAVIKLQKNKKNESRLRRHARVRATISGTTERPRLAVFKSNRYIYAQVIDDIKGVTICQASSMKDTKGTMTEKAKKVGVAVAKEAIGKKINEVVFDRGGFRFTGRVAALAEAAREGGLKF